MHNLTIPIETLKKIRGSESSRSELLQQLVTECREAQMPVIKIFTPTATEMFMDVHLAFLFTARTDWQHFYWYCSPRMGMCVADTRITAGKNWLPFEEWEPEGDLYVFQYWGATGMRPEEWVKQRLAGNSDESS